MAGPDIFLSYAHNDAEAARLYAEAFKREGFEVWWDDELRSGEVFDEAIEAALGAAKAVIVLWSPHSVGSRWVRAEATEAERNRTLVPVIIEPCKRPIIFELLQTTDLAHWRGDARDAAWTALIAHLRKFVGLAAPSAPAMPKSPAHASVAVLPFANMSGDPEQEYFADGISEDIITDLSKVSALMVIARNTAFTFKGKHVDVADVARQLGVSHVLEGSVRKAGNRVRVTAQLIDGATGGHVWAERYDRDLDDIFAIQDELSEAIVGALKVRLLPGEKEAIEARGTRNAEAYDHYIRARGLRASLEMRNLRSAVEAYRQAIALDPEFAMAWAGLASVLLQNMGLATKPSPSIRKEMEDAQARAIELAPESPDIVVGRAGQCLSNRDWAGAEKALAWFREKNDSSWSMCSHILLALGRADAAAEHQLQVWRSDPLSVGAAWGLQYHLDCAGRRDEAEADYAKSKDLHGHRPAFEWLATVRMMAARNHDEVRRRFTGAFGADTERQPFGPDLLEVLDRPDAAIAVLRSAAADPACSTHLHMNSIAHWAAYFGDDELALELLRKDAGGMMGFMIMDVWHPNFAGVRRLPQFKDVLAAARLPEHWRSTGNWGDFARPLGDDDFEVIG